MKSADIFNNDVSENGHYRYSYATRYSSIIAAGIQTRELIAMIKRHTPQATSILDAGCGDGYFTFELLKSLKPKKLFGFDPAPKSIQCATKDTPKEFKKIAVFKVGDIFKTSKFIKSGEYDIVVIRGVLHHLEKAKEAIEELSKIATDVYILEPSGYNPILKVIEKTSPYHREHWEKSYYPPTLNKWLTDRGYTIVEQKFFSLVPYFAPDWMVTILLAVTPFLESIPFFHKIYCGTNLLYAKKTFTKPKTSRKT